MWMGVWARGLGGMVGALALGLLGCSNDEDTRFGPPSSCLVEKPCPDDARKTCEVPCEGGPPAVGSSGGNGGAGGTGAGGEGGAGPVDVLGSVVAFTSAEFEGTEPYLDAVNIVAPGVDTDTVEAVVEDGTFSLVGAASGVQWVLAADAAGASGGAFSTYSLQNMTDLSAVVVPVVPVEVLSAVASQIDVSALTTGRAHVVLAISDDAGAALAGVSVLALSGGTVGYDSGPGFFTSNATDTGNLGLAVTLNALVAGAGTVKVAMTYLDTEYSATIPIAPNTVTYGRIGLDLTP